MNGLDSSAPTRSERRTAILLIEGNNIDLPIRSGSIGPDVIDIGKVYRETGCFAYDAGFNSTANCTSRITFIDG
jgi:citrate synthase